MNLPLAPIHANKIATDAADLTAGGIKVSSVPTGD